MAKAKNIHPNHVEDFLKANSEKKLSIRTIKKNLNMNYRQLFFYIKHSNNIKNVPPHEVGSGSKFLHIYQYEKQD
tara:strand:+ start:11544 stop:11768 length:225 start_codon:yes stop_codon:yes gene_type:complete